MFESLPISCGPLTYLKCVTKPEISLGCSIAASINTQLPSTLLKLYYNNSSFICPHLEYVTYCSIIGTHIKRKILNIWRALKNLFLGCVLRHGIGIASMKTYWHNLSFLHCKPGANSPSSAIILS